MPKYFVDEGMRLGEDTVRHLRTVLRAKVGEKIILCDGQAVDYHCVVESLDPFRYRVESREESGTEPRCKITLYQAMPKADKLEWIVQKAVELGVHAVVPVYTERSINKNARLDRLQKIAESAAGQSMRGIIPNVCLPVSMDEAMKLAMSGTDYMLAAHEKADQGMGNLPDEDEINGIGLWIGPEGGFSEKETAAMEGAGFRLMSLGPRILRTETAAIAAIAQIMMVKG